MSCETNLKPKQTITQRAEEIRRAVARLSDGLGSGRIKAVIGPQGAVAFQGFNDQDRDGVTDACAYRQLMIRGSALAKAKVEQAAQLAGRSINKQAIGQGAHSHDGGRTWHDHKG